MLIILLVNEVPSTLLAPRATSSAPPPPVSARPQYLQTRPNGHQYRAIRQRPASAHEQDLTTFIVPMKTDQNEKSMARR
jgi:hypothetical protein